MTVAYKYQELERRNSRIKVRSSLKLKMEKIHPEHDGALIYAENYKENHLPGEHDYRCSNENEKILAGKNCNIIPSLTTRLYRVHSDIHGISCKRQIFIPNQKNLPYRRLKSESYLVSLWKAHLSTNCQTKHFLLNTFLPYT